MLIVCLSVGLSFVCPVCKRQTLPCSWRNEPIQDPEDPDRFKVCLFCREKVPFSIRRTKSYQVRWDKLNARELWRELQYLQEAKVSDGEE